MDRPRWPMLIAGGLGVLVIVAVAFVAGRASAPEDVARAQRMAAPAGAIRVVQGVPVGVEHNRAGALAASDNYVAASSDTLVQDPVRYRQLVRQVYASAYQDAALRTGLKAREDAPQSVDLYAAGGRSVAVVGARRLDSYSDSRARTTTWVAGITWGPGRVPAHTWSLVESTLRWVGGRWRIEKLDVADRASPAPRRLGYSSDAQLKTSTFDRELRGMTAPIYGVE